jgi:hypothetical protein
MLLLAALLLAQTAPAPAACTGAVDASLPAPFAGWTAPGTNLAPGQAAVLESRDDPAFTASIPGAKPGRVASTDFTIARSGVYSIALDQKAWIDVLPAGGGAALKSVSHREGDPCWSIRKIVRFQLEAGSYRLALTGMTQPRAKVMLVPGE